MTSADFSPNCLRVVTTASRDNTARVWDAVTGYEISRLSGHQDAISQAAFSPNGARVVTASLDKTARVWDAATGEELARLEGHADWVRAADFSLDGHAVVTASADKTARVWHVFPSTDEFVQAAKSRMFRCLTHAQRKQYFLPPAPPTWCVERRLWPYHSDELQAWLPKRKAWLSTREGPEPELPNDPTQ